MLCGKNFLTGPDKYSIQNEKMVKDGNLLRGRKLVKLKATKYVTTVLIFIYPIFFQL